MIVSVGMFRNIYDLNKFAICLIHVWFKTINVIYICVIFNIYIYNQNWS